LFMLSELQPCVISIRLKFAQRKQNKKSVTNYFRKFKKLQN
jgi:hypothetical protein